MVTVPVGDEKLRYVPRLRGRNFEYDSVSNSLSIRSRVFGMARSNDLRKLTLYSFPLLSCLARFVWAWNSDWAWLPQIVCCLFGWATERLFPCRWNRVGHWLERVSCDSFSSYSHGCTRILVNRLRLCIRRPPCEANIPGVSWCHTWHVMPGVPPVAGSDTHVDYALEAILEWLSVSLHLWGQHESEIRCNCRNNLSSVFQWLTPVPNKGFLDCLARN